MAQWVKNPTRIHEDVGASPGLAPWAEDPAWSRAAVWAADVRGSGSIPGPGAPCASQAALSSLPAAARALQSPTAPGAPGPFLRVSCPTTPGCRMCLLPRPCVPASATFTPVAASEGDSRRDMHGLAGALEQDAVDGAPIHSPGGQTSETMLAPRRPLPEVCRQPTPPRVLARPSRCVGLCPDLLLPEGPRQTESVPPWWPHFSAAL